MVYDGPVLLCKGGGLIWKMQILPSIKLVNSTSLNFFGVLDGHGGDLTSKYCGEHLVETIVEQEPFQKVTNALESNLLKEAMSLAHLQMDEKLKRLPAMSQGDTSGSTGITGFVTPRKL